MKHFVRSLLSISFLGCMLSAFAAQADYKYIATFHIPQPSPIIINMVANFGIGSKEACNIKKILLLGPSKMFDTDTMSFTGKELMEMVGADLQYTCLLITYTATGRTPATNAMLLSQDGETYKMTPSKFEVTLAKP